MRDSYPKISDKQKSLFNRNINEMLLELDVNINYLKHMRSLNLISFDVKENMVLDSWEEQEIRFITPYFKSGLPINYLIKMFSHLERPYSYLNSRIYWDFLKEKWEVIPTVEEVINENMPKYYEDHFYHLMDIGAIGVLDDYKQLSNTLLKEMT